MIFMLHYGLWYGGLVGIIPFMFNYAAEYSGASGIGQGALYTVLPFVALVAKPIICSIADKYAAHHHCLLLFIFTTILGYGSLAIYPFFPDLIANHKNVVWILYCIAAFVGNTSMCIVNSIGDSLAMNSCQRKNINFGNYRLWGPVGFGLFGAIWGVANEIPVLPKYTPGILTMVVILLTNSLLLAFWYDRDEFKILRVVKSRARESSSSESSNYGTNKPEETEAANEEANQEFTKVKRTSLLLKLAREHSSVFFYLILFTFCGLLTGIHWQFFFRYLEQVSSTSKSNFSTITTLALPVQSLGGELVFFLLSGMILEKIGSSFTLALCLSSFAARYLLYAYVIPHTNIYYILFVELFQGPAFGLMYCALTYKASYYSGKIDEIVASVTRPGDKSLENSLQATLQGSFGASFEGLGLGLGALIGGWAFDLDPILMWQIAGYSALAMAIIMLIIAIVTSMGHSSRSTTAAELA